MERIIHVKENFPHFQERVLRRLFYEHFSLGNKPDDAHKMVHIKSKQMDLNEMASSKVVQDEHNDHLFVR